MVDLYTGKSVKSLAKDAYSEISHGQVSEFCSLNKIPFDSRLKVMMVVTVGSGGVGYYRAVQPCRYLNRLMGDKVIAIATEAVTPELIYGWADVIVLSRMSHPEFFMFAKRTKAAMVYELDDLIHDIGDHNPAGRDWHKQTYRYWWSKEILGACPYLQTSTAELQRIHSPGKTKSIVLENMVDPDLFPTPTREKSASIRIGWQGSATHYRDLLRVKGALLKIQSEYGEAVKFIFAGWNGKYGSPVTGDKVDALKGLVRKSYGWQNIHDGSYYKFLAGLNLDIAIAPLEDTPFNQCKSNIKVLEYGACGYAVLADDVAPYRSLDMPQLLVKDWYADLKKLIDEPGIGILRADALSQRVHSKYDIKQRIHEYFDFYKSL
jgi:hypothetical protein